MAKQGSSARRWFLFSGVAGLVTGVLAKVGWGASREEVVRSHMRVGEPPGQPLDTMVLFERGDENNGRAMTHEVLSLVHQEKGRNSYPWTLYTSLETHHENGDACVHCARLHKAGVGWSAGVHSEVFTHARGVALGGNIEMSNDYAGGEEQTVIGLNIQAVGGPREMQYGIQVHDGGNDFRTGVLLAGAGSTGVDLTGKFEVGVHLHGNPLRVSEGTPIQLDDEGRIQIRYRKGKVEFVNGERVFCELDVERGVEEKDEGGRMNEEGRDAALLLDPAGYGCSQEYL